MADNNEKMDKIISLAKDAVLSFRAVKFMVVWPTAGIMARLVICSNKTSKKPGGSFCSRKSRYGSFGYGYHYESQSLGSFRASKNFSDPLVECKFCHHRFREDHCWKRAAPSLVMIKKNR